MNYTEQFKKQRYAIINYPKQLETTMHQAAAAWKEFCALPNEVKLGLDFENYGGYELKTDSDHDLKENIHYSLSKRDKFIAFANTLPECDQAIVMTLANITEQVIDQSAALIEGFITDIEDGLGIPNIARPVMNFKDHWVVRYLHYFPTDDLSQHAAAPHCDIGGFTLHLFQDHPGLEYLDNELQWHALPLEDGYTSILPGMQMQHRTENHVTSTCHRVIPTEASAVTGRYSAVLFTNWPDGSNYDKATHGKMSAFEPGFNYKMTFEQFDKLFEKDVDLQEI